MTFIKIPSSVKQSFKVKVKIEHLSNFSSYIFYYSPFFINKLVMFWVGKDSLGCTNMRWRVFGKVSMRWGWMKSESHAQVIIKEHSLHTMTRRKSSKQSLACFSKDKVSRTVSPSWSSIYIRISVIVQ